MRRRLSCLIGRRFVGDTGCGLSPSGPPEHRTAAAIVKKLKSAGLPIGEVAVYDASSDPSRLLGTANGYASKAAFTDEQVGPAATTGFQVGDVEAGGVVEVYANPAAAQARLQSIQDKLKNGQNVGAEYEFDYVNGGVLLRVSGVLTAEEAKAYQRALEKTSVSK